MIYMYMENIYFIQNMKNPFCIELNKMKNPPKKYYTVETVAKSNRKIIERGEIDISNTQIYDRSLSCLGTGTSIKSGWFKLVLLTQTSPLSEMIQSCKCFSHMSKIPT